MDRKNLETFVISLNQPTKASVAGSGTATVAIGVTTGVLMFVPSDASVNVVSSLKVTPISDMTGISVNVE